MNDIPKQKLREIIAQYGKEIASDPKRCEAILRDFCSQYRREVSVLVSAQKEQIPTELLYSHNSVPFNVTAARLVKRLQDNLGLAEDVSRWAVNAWALALGLISETEPTVLQPAVTAAAPPQIPQDYRQDNVYPPQQPNPAPQTMSQNGANQIQGNNFSDELHKANQHIKSGWIAGIVLSVFTAINVLVSMNLYIFIDVFLIGGLTFGLYKKSRVCAVILLAYYACDKLIAFSNPGTVNTNSIPFIILFFYFFIQAVRGTFTYHSLTKSQP